MLYLSLYNRVKKINLLNNLFFLFISLLKTLLSIIKVNSNSIIKLFCFKIKNRINYIGDGLNIVLKVKFFNF